jgi:ribosomal protein L44E
VQNRNTSNGELIVVREEFLQIRRETREMENNERRWERFKIGYRNIRRAEPVKILSRREKIAESQGAVS